MHFPPSSVHLLIHLICAIYAHMATSLAQEWPATQLFYGLWATESSIQEGQLTKVARQRRSYPLLPSMDPLGHIPKPCWGGLCIFTRRRGVHAFHGFQSEIWAHPFLSQSLFLSHTFVCFCVCMASETPIDGVSHTTSPMHPMQCPLIPLTASLHLYLAHSS